MELYCTTVQVAEGRVLYQRTKPKRIPRYKIARGIRILCGFKVLFDSHSLVVTSTEGYSHEHHVHIDPEEGRPCIYYVWYFRVNDDPLTGLSYSTSVIGKACHYNPETFTLPKAPYVCPPYDAVPDYGPDYLLPIVVDVPYPCNPPEV